jgi:flagellar basal body-associated protein FliL
LQDVPSRVSQGLSAGLPGRLLERVQLLIWCAAVIAALAEAIGVHRIAAAFRITVILLAVLLILVMLSGSGYVFVMYRKHRSRRRPMIPAPDPELTQRTRTVVDSVTVLPLEQGQPQAAIGHYAEEAARGR